MFFKGSDEISEKQEINHGEMQSGFDKNALDEFDRLFGNRLESSKSEQTEDIRNLSESEVEREFDKLFGEREVSSEAFQERNIRNLSESEVEREFDKLFGEREVSSETFQERNGGEDKPREYTGTEIDTMNENHDIEENRYGSTYEERLIQTPKEDSDRGEWSGDRGESEFIPNDKEVQEILTRYDKESIEYEDAIPDFSEVSESTVEIDHMTDNRADNFRQCDEKCAEQWNKEGRDERTDWTARDVKKWRQENGYTWHERNDMKTCDLIPTKVNDYFGHLGGVAECRKRDMENGGNDFDV